MVGSSSSEAFDMNQFKWGKNTVEPDSKATMLYYHEYVVAQQVKDKEITGSNVQRDKSNYQKAYGEYCNEYRGEADDIR